MSLKSFGTWLQEKFDPKGSYVLVDTVDKVKQALYSLLMVDANENTYTQLRGQYEPLIFDGPAGEMARWLQSYVPQFAGQIPPKAKCGQEGCAYFVSPQLVVKATLGKYEIQIASIMKGTRDVVPVIDIHQHSQGVGLILMDRLLTEWGDTAKRKIDMAGMTLREYIMELSDQSLFTEAEFRKYVQQLGFDNRTVKYIMAIFRIVATIHQKSGYLIHDIHAGNVGIQRQPGQRPQPGQGTATKKKKSLRDLRILDTGMPSQWDDENKMFRPAR